MCFIQTTAFQEPLIGLRSYMARMCHKLSYIVIGINILVYSVFIVYEKVLILSCQNIQVSDDVLN